MIDFNETRSRIGGFPGYTTLKGAFLTILRMPLIIEQITPFIALFVGMIVIITLNRRYELVVSRAAGISIWQLLSPFIIGAFLLGVFTIICINPLAVFGDNKAVSLIKNWREESHIQKDSTIIPWINQNNGKERLIIGFKAISPEKTKLLEPTVIHLDSGNNITLRQDAVSAILGDGYILLEKVIEYRYGARPIALESVKIKSNLQKKFLNSLFKQANSIPFYELPQKIIYSHVLGLETYPLESQFYFLLGTPFLLIAMTLIAGVISLNFNRTHYSQSLILSGIFSGFILYIIIVLIKAFGKSGIISPLIVTSVPIIVAISLTATVLLWKEDG
ncbi:putative permease [Liberibacter crescens BT-1]|uniref:Putative permease n=2 Tax=Liberibacter crescens TaxID=1273132 RepID=L0ETR7_LIBCB|nr:putative permease [Liberibacter crescens BT-1]